MAFEGWDSVAARLRVLSVASGLRLNDGQRDSLDALAARIPEHGIVIADEVGMGKTRVAVALARAVIEAGGRVAILIPPTLGFQWREELRHGGVPDAPDVVRSLWGFLEAWEPGGQGRCPWFEHPLLLISHGFANWRLGPTTKRWRFELLPMLAGYARKELEGRFPHGFGAMSSRADEWVRSAAQSIAGHCAPPASAEVRQRYEALGNATAWREANEAANYEHGGEPRRLLQSAVGLGLGAFDLIVVDEAHKSRGEDAGLSRLLESTLLAGRAPRRLCMTATPVELDAEDWNQALARIQVDPSTRARIRAVVERYGSAARRVRLSWRSSADARDAYVAAASAFEAALKPYVLRRDKRGDEDVILFRSTSWAEAAAAREAGGETRDADAYRWQRDIAVEPRRLPLDWRKAVCAAEALSFVVHSRDNQAAQRLRLTFGNGHGIATRLDAATAGAEDDLHQPGDLEEGHQGLPYGERAGATAGRSGTTLSDAKRVERAAWWQGLVERVANTEGALYDHPSVLATVQAIEEYDSQGEKVLVFGRFTGPMRALVELLNARAMLRALDAGEPWPQSRIAASEVTAVAVAHRQLGRSGTFDRIAMDAVLVRQYARIERRREALRSSLFDLISAGISEQEQNARALAQAAQAGGDDARALLAAAIDQLLDGRHPSEDESLKAGAAGAAPGLTPELVAEAFVSLIAALRERGEGDADGNGELGPGEAGDLWGRMAGRLANEYRVERGRFARLLNGATELSTRRALQLAFNRQEANPRVLVAQSLVGREGLNLHQACRVVVLLHPEWNPGIIEQQIGRVDRVGSRWAHALHEAVRERTSPLPRIEIRPVIFEGTYDSYHWRILHERWDDLRAYLHGVVVPHRFRIGCTDQELAELSRLDAAAPNLAPAGRLG